MPSGHLVVLGEDELHMFVLRRFLKMLGFLDHALTERIAPKGCAFDWVIQHYPIEVQALRSATKKQGLLVVLDADADEVERRHQQLRHMLKEHGGAARTQAEPIAMLVARRNMETWVHYLLGSPADEETNYKQEISRKVRDQYLSSCKAAPARLVEIFRLPAPPADCPPSLVRACQELHQLFAALA